MSALLGIGIDLAWLQDAEALRALAARLLLVSCRLAPLTLIAPWLMLKSFPFALRIAVVVSLGLALHPPALEASASVDRPWALLSLALFEVLLGSVFALVVALPLHAAEWAGRWVDLWRGASLSEALLPTTSSSTSPLGDLFLLLAILLFWSSGAHRVALSLYADSLLALPIGSVGELQSLRPALLALLRLLADGLALSLVLALPAGAAILFAELALGLVARSVPAIPVYFAAMPLRAALGLFAVALASVWLLRTLFEAFALALSQLEQVIRSLPAR